MLHVGKIRCVSLSTERKCPATNKKKETIQKVLVHRASTLKINNRFKIGFVDENFINVTV